MSNRTYEEWVKDEEDEEEEFKSWGKYLKSFLAYDYLKALYESLSTVDFWKKLICCKCKKKKISKLSQEDREDAYAEYLDESEYIFLLELDRLAQNHLAHKLGIQVFDSQKKYYKPINVLDTTSNEPFRDVQI